MKSSLRYSSTEDIWSARDAFTRHDVSSLHDEGICFENRTWARNGSSSVEEKCARQGRRAGRNKAQKRRDMEARSPDPASFRASSRGGGATSRGASGRETSGRVAALWETEVPAKKQPRREWRVVENGFSITLSNQGGGSALLETSPCASLPAFSRSGQDSGGSPAFSTYECALRRLTRTRM